MNPVEKVCALLSTIPGLQPLSDSVRRNLTGICVVMMMHFYMKVTKYM
jgi:hypothetical protein